ncbi:hypothetical protein Xen7305DRAFT_00023980 [Xenococcus sp. PCC 7305]|uniref:DUF1456 family protein n=1 Tax=Xenococcus sp. PCC 7305 TaxID=102125 RepID=UPI0002ABF244|nr:DUF1456 family protein [Xenococcus sp. PCC 7305]ELS02680.1 hypothetical protein Xen7305DRAFT_00023980 [Xenococcus sp. PCC 7305]
MTNNDVLRRLRYILDLTDSMMIAVFRQADLEVDREQISNWLKRDDDPDYQNCNDKQLAMFLNGLINHKRGKKEGEQPKPETRLTNNIVLKKLKIAFNLKSEDMLEIIDYAGLALSKHELSAFFRKPDHKHYRECKDQVLRNFLQGLQAKYRQGLNNKSFT